MTLIMQDPETQYLLDQIPQQKPFRYIDRIEQVNSESIIGSYTYRDDEWFWPQKAYHRPIPSTILIETMAQIGIVAFGLYLLGQNHEPSPAPASSPYIPLFADIKAHFFQQVYSNQKVIVQAEKIFFRRRILRVHATLHSIEYETLAEATLSGIGKAPEGRGKLMARQGDEENPL
jgi:3-hydroxyacyl-[acyl-carrier-protein] dehydratase